MRRHALPLHAPAYPSLSRRDDEQPGEPQQDATVEARGICARDARAILGDKTAAHVRVERRTETGAGPSP